MPEETAALLAAILETRPIVADLESLSLSV
jgi:hypothetical protein